MRLSFFVVAASLKQVSAQDDGSGAELMDCHRVRGDRFEEDVLLTTERCNQTGSWLEEDATICFFGQDSRQTGLYQYAGCGQEINCRGMYDIALARGHVDDSNKTFCVENITGFPPVAPTEMGNEPIIVTLCCQAIYNGNYHRPEQLPDDIGNEWDPQTIENILANDNTIKLTNDQVTAVATEEEEEDDDNDTLTIALGTVGGALFLGSVAYIIKKKVYDKDASFMPLEFLL